MAIDFLAQKDFFIKNMPYVPQVTDMHSSSLTCLTASCMVPYISYEVLAKTVRQCGRGGVLVLCPNCLEYTAVRSHRRGIEVLLSIFRIFPYRCEICERRFLRLRKRKKLKQKIH